ncbi:hypothetical protein THAOC_26960 [Thalassiosira oceanica]|uniref:Uncharacterized protein n=1 Tax=Thalassiosira oceanica TaxID=159749 RepID=K0RXK1_THAOC|nr:hypothetical protein THAOC_26960 [Thalassiosira oceanica]|eukprot:EJK53576.1 hypothetical protein THAOC_26960 [Thalassiosira oceanica]
MMKLESAKVLTSFQWPGDADGPGLTPSSSGSNSLTKGSNVANLGKRNVEAPGKSLSDRTEAVGDNWALAPAPNIHGTKSRRANEAEATLVRSPLDTARGSVDSTEARLPSTFAASRPASKEEPNQKRSSLPSQPCRHEYAREACSVFNKRQPRLQGICNCRVQGRPSREEDHPTYKRSVDEVMCVQQVSLECHSRTEQLTDRRTVDRVELVRVEEEQATQMRPSTNENAPSRDHGRRLSGYEHLDRQTRKERIEAGRLDQINWRLRPKEGELNQDLIKSERLE